MIAPLLWSLQLPLTAEPFRVLCGSGMPLGWRDVLLLLLLRRMPADAVA